MAKQSKNNSTSTGTNADLDLAVQGINKKFGDGALMRLGDATKMNVSVISTGSLAIDLALGPVGCPEGGLLKFMAQNLLEKQLSASA